MNFISRLFNRSKNKKNTNSSIYDIDESTINPIDRSKIFYETHLKNIGKIEFKNIQFMKQRELSPEELSFLKYIENKTLNNIAGYWTHEVNLNINKTIKDFLSMNLVEFLIIPENLTIPEIKELLDLKNLPKKGKKFELIFILKQNFSKNEIDSFETYSNKRKFILTEIGKKLVENLPPKITHNHIFDKKCLDAIMQRKFETVYRDICLYENNKSAKRGIGIDWQKEYISVGNNNLSSYNVINFEDYDNLFDHIFLDNDTANKLYISLIIYFDMLGKSNFTDSILEFYVPNYYNESSEDLIKTACINVNKIYTSLVYTDFKRYEDMNSTEIKNNLIAEKKWFKNSRIGNYYLRVGKIDKAIEYLEKSIFYNSQIVNDYNTLINIYKKYGFENSYMRIEYRLQLLLNYNNNKKILSP